jgi:hypothetical protein
MQASIYADVVGSKKLDDPDALVPVLGEAVRMLNHEFAPVVAEPFVVDFGDEIRGSIADPAETPLCVSVMRECLAPVMLRVGIGIGQSAEDAFTIAKHEDILIHYMGIGEAADLLLNAYCRLLDPVIRRRTAKQWEAIRAMRTRGDRTRAAQSLGIARQSLSDRLRAANFGLIEEADATVANYLAAIAYDSV